MAKHKHPAVIPPATLAAVLMVTDAALDRGIAIAFRDMTAALLAQAERLAGEFGQDNLAVLALTAAAVAASDAGLKASGRASASVGALTATVGNRVSPAPVRAPASVAAPAGGTQDSTQA